MSKKTVQLSFFVVFTVILLVLLFFVFKPFLGVLFVAGVFAVTFYPVYEKFIEKLKGRKKLAAFVVTLLILALIIMPIIILSAFLLKETADLYNSIAINHGPQNFISQINVFIDRANALFPSEAANFSQINIESYVRNALSWIIGNFDSVFIAVFGGIFNFLLMLISLYYLFIFGDKIKNNLISWSPLPDEHDEEFIKVLRSSIDAVLRGRVLVAVVQGMFIGVGFAVFGIGSPILWGFVGGIASLVPVLGTSVVTVPAIAYLFLSHKIGAGIGLLVWGAVAVGLIDNFISIIFLKNKIKIHPLVVLFSILGGVEIFGVIGFLVGPIIVSASIALAEIYPFIMSYKSQSVPLTDR